MEPEIIPYKVASWKYPCSLMFPREATSSEMEKLYLWGEGGRGSWQGHLLYDQQSRKSSPPASLAQGFLSQTCTDTKETRSNCFTYPLFLASPWGMELITHRYRGPTAFEMYSTPSNGGTFVENTSLNPNAIPT